MANIPEQAGETARSAIEALRSNPTCLMGLLFGIVMAILTYATLRDDKQQAHERTVATLHILTECLVPATKAGR